MDKGDTLLAHNLDGVDWSKLAKIFTQLLFGDILWQITKIDIAGGTRLLDGQRDRSRNLRRLSPSYFDVLSFDRKLLEDSVRVKMGGGATIEEGDKGAVFIGQESDRFD